MFNLFNRNPFDFAQGKKINLGFWEKLKKPIMVIAPMADVTDVAFRQMFAKYGKPDVMWTEFVSCDGLVMAPHHLVRGKHPKKISPQEILWRDLKYFENERPIVAQIFSSNFKMMKQAAYLVTKAGFDGIDINMGCPAKAIQKQESGAALIKNPKRAVGIIKAAKKGIKKACREMNKEEIPLSVKTRIGYNKDTMEEWTTTLLKQNIAVLSIHARTKKEMSKVPAHWNRIKDAVQIRDSLGVETLILGNGDIKDLEDATKKVKESGCDGAMIGRGVFGNPYFFSGNKEERDEREKLKTMVEHTYLFEKYLDHKNFNIMKKHYKAYVNGFSGAKELRLQLMNAKNGKEVESIVDSWLK
jgi:nifR3 family TIM-barrel protein